MTPVTLGRLGTADGSPGEGAVGRLARQRRIRCRLACEVLGQGRRPVRAVVCSLSAGGLGLEARLRVDQGDAIQLRILPHRQGGAVTVGAIVWNDRPARGAGGKGALRVLGCVVSDPPQSYLDLLAEVAGRDGEEEPLPLLQRPAATRDVPPADVPRDEDLPRSREPMPPPKPEPEELLPGFRVRVKQVGGHRTRMFRARATSLSEAADRVVAALAHADGEWEVLAAAKEEDGNGSLPPACDGSTRPKAADETGNA